MNVDVYWPVRCYTCNKVIGNKQRLYEERLQEGALPGEILDELGFERYCCRMMALAGGTVVDTTSVHPVGSKAESKFSDEARRLIAGVRALSIDNVPQLPSGGSLESMQNVGDIDAESSRSYEPDEVVETQTRNLLKSYTRPLLLPPTVRSGTMGDFGPSRLISARDQSEIQEQIETTGLRPSRPILTEGGRSHKLVALSRRTQPQLQSQQPTTLQLQSQQREIGGFGRPKQPSVRQTQLPTRSVSRPPVSAGGSTGPGLGRNVRTAKMPTLSSLGLEP